MPAKRLLPSKAKARAKPSELLPKQQRFVDSYFEFGMNATRAAKEAGYAFPNQQGPRLLVNVGIRKVIDTRLAAMGMGADEVLVRLTDMACASMEDFFSADGGAYRLDLKQAQKRGKMHLVKKYRTGVDSTSIELHDPQAALVQLGRHHGLFVDRQEFSGTVESVDAKARLLSKFAQSPASPAADGVPGGAGSG